MSITIEKAVEISEKQINEMLEMDCAKALTFINEQLKLFETKYGITTSAMLQQYSDNGIIDSYIQDWHDLVVMKKDLECNVTGT